MVVIPTELLKWYEPYAVVKCKLCSSSSGAVIIDEAFLIIHLKNVHPKEFEDEFCDCNEIEGTHRRILHKWEGFEF